MAAENDHDKQANEHDGRKQPYEDNFADEHGVIMEFKESKSNKQTTKDANKNGK